MPRGELRHTIRMMNKKLAFRALCGTALTVGLKLRVLMLVFAVALAPLGVTFKLCHCTPCESTCSDAPCCRTNLEVASCCDPACCDGQCCDIPIGFAVDDLECDCTCHVCQCDLGLIVDPKKFPGINDGDSPLLDDIRWYVELATANFNTVRPDNFTLPLARDLRALHCRWLI